MIKSIPRGEGAPVRTLGRMRNGDIFHYQLQLVKMIAIISYFRLNQVHYALPHIAVPHPSRLRRSTFPPGEGFGALPRQHHRTIPSGTQWSFDYHRTVHALTAGAARTNPNLLS